jgi:hypothetical protein
VGVGVAFAIALLAFEAIPTVYPNICREEPFPTINTVHQYERETGLVGVDPEGSYFPRTVAQRPSSSPLEANYQANETPQRLDTAVFPPGTTIETVEYDKRGVTAVITSPEPFTARYLSFDFPGWVALVDGQLVPIRPEDSSGLITFAVPAGRHEIAVRWQSTPTRTALLGLSVFSLAGVLVVLLVLAKTQSSVSGKRLSVSSERHRSRPHLLDFIIVLSVDPTAQCAGNHCLIGSNRRCGGWRGRRWTTRPFSRPPSYAWRGTA